MFFRFILDIHGPVCKMTNFLASTLSSLSAVTWKEFLQSKPWTSEHIHVSWQVLKIVLAIEIQLCVPTLRSWFLTPAMVASPTGLEHKYKLYPFSVWKTSETKGRDTVGMIWLRWNMFSQMLHGAWSCFSDGLMGKQHGQGTDWCWRFTPSKWCQVQRPQKGAVCTVTSTCC